MDKINLKKYLDQQTYDKYYQDVEIINFVGYSKSYETWNSINTLNIDWNRKTVCDLGCFHSYFGIKALKAGAEKVYGLDNHEGVLNTAKLISELSNVKIEHIQWEGGERTPTCDIALVLNMLHHCKDQNLTLKNTNCNFGIFEVYNSGPKTQINIIEKYFNILKTTPSARSQRVILYGEKIEK